MLQGGPPLVLNHGPPVLDQVHSNFLVLRAEEQALSFAYLQEAGKGVPCLLSYSQHIIDLEHVLI